MEAPTIQNRWWKFAIQLRIQTPYELHFKKSVGLALRLSLTTGLSVRRFVSRRQSAKLRSLQLLRLWRGLNGTDQRIEIPRPWPKDGVCTSSMAELLPTSVPSHWASFAALSGENRRFVVGAGEGNVAEAETLCIRLSVRELIDKEESLESPKETGLSTASQK